MVRIIHSNKLSKKIIQKSLQFFFPNLTLPILGDFIEKLFMGVLIYLLNFNFLPEE